jgi:hypothetical protein
LVGATAQSIIDCKNVPKRAMVLGTKVLCFISSFQARVEYQGAGGPLRLAPFASARYGMFYLPQTVKSYRLRVCGFFKVSSGSFASVLDREG